MKLLIAAGALICFAPPSIFAQSPEQVEFFEKSVRPVFANSCQACHNQKVKTGGLDLSSADGLREAAAAGFFGAPDQPEASLLFRALSYEHRVKMPPQGKLPEEKLSAIRAWIGHGAPLPGGASSTGVRTAKGVITEEDRNFWSFRPLSKAVPPETARKDWAASPIDQFILARLEGKGLTPAPPADKVTLLRRATYDLTGLPPTEQEIRDFVRDDSPDAFAKVIDRLLASPRYGERWGRHWLDVMRYADSTGSDEDHRYPHAWRYRDYVVQAFNEDKPYDQFVREQLAGDILAADESAGVGPSGIVATGFLALGKKALAQKDLVLKRYDVVDDQIDVTSKALLGLTVACARCHDHKFDPIATKDYYSMAAIFASTLSYAKGETGPSVETPLVPEERYKEFKERWDAVLEVEGKIQKILDFDREAKRTRDARKAKMPEYMLGAHRIYAGGEAPAKVAAELELEERVLVRWAGYLKDEARPELAKWHAATDDERRQVAEHYRVEFEKGAYQYDQDLSWWKNARKTYPASGKLAGPRPETRSEDAPFFHAVWIDSNGPLYLSAEEQIDSLPEEKAEAVRALIAERIELERSAPTEEIPMACAVREGEPIEQKVFVRGDHNNLGEPVGRAFPSILSDGEPDIHTASGRLELANWIVSGGNPLPPRVMVNRIWQGHFGEGLVRTPDNFGKLGEKPTHPELLDYLARQFIDNGWSIKKMHRMIMLSSTYRMSAAFDETKKAEDPENRLLSRFPKRRLSIEELRDSLLAIGGNLDLTMGGTLDPGVGTDGETSASRISMSPESTDRRSIYLPLRRSNLPTLYTLFDFGDAASPEGKRNSTTVATQALFLMNSPLVQRQAESLARRLLAEEQQDSRRLERAYIVTLQRRPEAAEIDAGLTYVQSFRQKWQEIGEEKAWQSLCRVLMASNEFIYVY